MFIDAEALRLQRRLEAAEAENRRLRTVLALHVNRHGHVSHCHADPYAVPSIPCSPRCQKTREALAVQSGAMSAQGGD